MKKGMTRAAVFLVIILFLIISFIQQFILIAPSQSPPSAMCIGLSDELVRFAMGAGKECGKARNICNNENRCNYEYCEELISQISVKIEYLRLQNCCGGVSQQACPNTPVLIK